MTEGETLTVTVPVTNTGSRTGSEIVQLYISDVKSSLPRPEKELKGFTKLTVEPGQTVNAVFTIDRDALAYFDPEVKTFVAEPGKFKARVGASAGDIRGTVDFELISNNLSMNNKR